MRHSKHKHTLGVKKEHRAAIMASLAAALFRHDRIETTLASAKALRPFAEKIITLAKNAVASEDAAVKLHYRRLAIARIRDVEAVAMLFGSKDKEGKVSKFVNRKGGYTRIYKLVPRAGDAAHMALIELIEADDEGYKAAKKPAAKKTAKKAATKKAATKKTAKKTTKKAEAAPAEDAEKAAE